MEPGAAYTNKALLAQVAEGSEDAFRTLFQQYAPKLKAYLLKLSRSPETTEDILHDVFLNIWKNRERLNDINDFNSYLFTAARNTAHRSFRRRAQETLIIAELNQSSVTESVSEGEDRIVTSEVRRVVKQAIDRLTPQQRKIFLLSRQQGISHQQIADELGIAIRTVKNTITDALRSLRDDIGNQYGTYAIAIYVLYGLG